MNLPAINNKMKNHNNQTKQDVPSLSDGFGLGIQVFKIQSAKNMDNGIKSKNRTMMKNIENPNQTPNPKVPFIPKPKILPSLEKSHSEINPKERLSGFLRSKAEDRSGYTDKILERKTPITESNTIITPASYSMRKKVGVSTQKNIISNQTTKPIQTKNYVNEKQRPSNRIPPKLNQTAPPEAMYKPQQIQYQHWNTQHDCLLRFYTQWQSCQKQHAKQIRNLKKLKENQETEEICYKIEYLQSVEGKIDTVIDNFQKQQFEEKGKQIAKVPKRSVNTIVPITGFEMSQMDLFEFDSIEKYQLGDYCGSFNVTTYENVDFAPVINIAKEQEEDDD